jgi:hypothetical protein
VVDSKVIQFPLKNQISSGIKVDNSAAEMRENIIFTENLTEALIVNLIHNMSENGIDVDTEPYIRDTSFLIEMVKSMIYRDSEMTHPFQNLVDMCVSSTKEGKSVHVEVDIDMIKEITGFNEEE